MKKTLLASGAILGIIALIGFGGYLYIQQSFSKTAEEEITIAAQGITEQEGEPEVEEVSKEPIEGGNKGDMDEKRIQKYLHLMTHQKVEAKEKWGAVEMTPENIENLLTIVESNQGRYENAAYYIEVLTQWQKGDFANAVEVHNYIWQLNGGTVGRATGLLDAAEEQIYIKKNFKD
ncbi:DUF6241 domain-containing protein [Planomicrobium sp. CPCC 101110]|uniref:DUF6241 domain-containing protein n=1 Tax=Planomicrobium sp. CPCC 101110 TaxID=2599619 RepID=UPI0011B4B58C|nr:DUF6241 domain-containing protein [Planomicrobium sp. CPCC 101110]TWT24235.1 hypothetical protein FQV30_15825 [Planomicrobium sp. CPCC 101110]